MEGRNYGIDLLRIVAMLMVVVLHLTNQGGILQNAAFLSGAYQVAWFYEIASFCAVNCYALVSGYVGVCAPYRPAHLAVLWLRVVYYTLLFTALTGLFCPSLLTGERVFSAFFPVLTKQYWYFTVYFMLFLFMPVLNTALEKLEKSQMRWVLLLCIGVYSVLQTVLKQRPFGVGYDFLWMVLMYLLGGYIRKYDSFSALKKGKAFLVYLGSIGVTWLSKIGVQFIGDRFYQTVFAGDRLISYYSPTILAAAVSLLLLFRKLPVSDRILPFVRFLAPLSFSVYLIHANSLVWMQLFSRRFEAMASLPAPVLALALPAAALLIYCACSAIDLLRATLFRKIRLQDRLTRLGASLWRRIR